jgi:hypothetical protein
MSHPANKQKELLPDQWAFIDKIGRVQTKVTAKDNTSKGRVSQNSW